MLYLVIYSTCIVGVIYFMLPTAAISRALGKLRFVYNVNLNAALQIKRLMTPIKQPSKYVL